MQFAIQTKSDTKAHEILVKAGVMDTSDDASESGNVIIELAAKIQAERQQELLKAAAALPVLERFLKRVINN